MKPGLHGNDDGAPLRREEGAPLGTDRRAEDRQTNILIRRSAQEAVLGKCCKWQTHTRNRLTEFPYGVQYFKHIISFPLKQKTLAKKRL